MKYLPKKIIVIVALGATTACYAQPLPANDSKDNIQILESISKNLAEEDYSSAKQNYLKLIELTPDEDEKDKLRLEIAEIDVAAGEYSEATKQITQILEKKGVSPDVKSAAYVSLGNVYKWQKDYLKASAGYRKAATVEKISPDQQWEARFMFYLMLSVNKSFDEARKELREARAIEGLPAWRVKSADKSIALTYLREGQYEKAREQYLEVSAEVSATDLKSLSDDEIGAFTSIYQDAQLGIGKSYFLEKNYGEARKVYEQILRMSDLEDDAKTEAQQKIAEIDLLEKG